MTDKRFRNIQKTISSKYKNLPAKFRTYLDKVIKWEIQRWF